MKLVKLQDNTSRQLSIIELLLSTIYGSDIPTAFIPGNDYIIGDKVYVESNGKITIHECVVSGRYTSVEGSGWKSFVIASENRSDNDINDFDEFETGVYEAGDIQIEIDGTTGELTVYECIVPGHYDTITNGGWDVIPFIPGNTENNNSLIQSIFDSSVISEHIPEKSYRSGEIVYVVDESTGSIILYENTDTKATTLTPPESPWNIIDAGEIIDSDDITKKIDFATDEDILNMFKSNSGSGNTPSFPGEDEEEDYEWEEF